MIARLHVGADASAIILAYPVLIVHRASTTVKISMAINVQANKSAC